MSNAQVTIAISDQCAGGLEGFAPLAKLPAATFDAAEEDGVSMFKAGLTYSFFLDLMDEDDTQVDEKSISLAQAATLSGIPADTIVSVGRQRLAQIDDEDAENLRKLRAAQAA